MQVEQTLWTSGTGWAPRVPGGLPHAQLVLVFGSPAQLRDETRHRTLKAAYPEALVVGCTTAGEIMDTRVLDETVAVTALQFAATRVRGVAAPVVDAQRSFVVGAQLAQALREPDLAHVLLVSEGLRINGSELVQGLTQSLPAEVAVTGGLAADGPRFGETLVLWSDVAAPHTVVAIGLYGRELRVGYGSVGGWDTFGPDRLITRSAGNVLYELDGAPALGLYTRYLGPQAADLPASGLLFPLSLASGPGTERIVRTILGVNQAEGSLTFAGDVPEGSYARLMKANFDRLIDGASDAATASLRGLSGSSAELALLVSCVGRKLVLQQRVEEEVEAVREVLGPLPALTGFYSYGEVAPPAASRAAALHNQTMTITTLTER